MMIFDDCPVEIYQDPVELLQLLEIYRNLRPLRVLEIGSLYGGTLWHWINNARQGSTIVSIDIPANNAIHPHGKVVEAQRLWTSWAERAGVTLEKISGNSRDPQVIKKARGLGQYDFIFVDGGHSYKMVSSDFANYWPLLRDGGVMAFHDISYPSGDIEVGKWWREVEDSGNYYTQTFRHGVPPDWWGIGIIHKAAGTKTFLYKPSNGKERAYVGALESAGYNAVHHRQRLPAKFALLDGDWGNDPTQYHPCIQFLERERVPLFLYPHGANPPLIWDGYIKPWPAKCYFAIAPGHKEIMQRFGYPNDVVVAGWSLCDLKPPQSVGRVTRILFGPIHPFNGWLHQSLRDLNAEVMGALVEYKRERGAHLSVRYIGSLGQCGLSRVRGVTYIRGNLDGSFSDIDSADLVVGYQTFAHIAIARGKPTLMMGEGRPPLVGTSDSNTRTPASWDKYSEYVRYPFDVLSGDLDETIQDACSPGSKINQWRDLFIGEQFAPNAFVKTVEGYL